MFTDFQNMLQTVNVGGFAWTDLLGQIFKGKLDLSKASSVLLPSGASFPTGAWTPSDASGAGLSFTTPTGKYIQFGNLIIANGALTYPVTVNGVNSAIGGFPFTVANLQEARAGSLNYHNGATAVKFLMANNTQVGNFYTAAGVNVTNAQMSGTLNYVQAIYFTS